ncbi:MAG: hypothetical protein V7K47_16680 [Nostoc sp.]
MSNSSFNLFDLNGSNGFIINGIAPGDNLGSSVSYAGDINNDGIDDLIIGAPDVYSNGITFAGQSYVVFGGKNVANSGFLNPSSLNGTNGFAINGIGEFERSGSSVSYAGDINNDGIDDLIIGAPTAFVKDNKYIGQSYVVFGGTNVGSSGTLNVSSLNGTNGFLITNFGFGNDAGDINNDGIDDLIVWQYDAGQSYVVFGGANVGSSGILDLSSPNSTNGFLIDAPFGNKVGDINNDGIDDLIFAEFIPYPNTGQGTVQTYVVFGGTNVGSSGNFNLSSLNGTNGFAINGISAVEYAGFSVSSAGDINGDGIDDLIIGAAGDFGSVGQSYVVFGGTNVGNSGNFNVSSLDGTNGFTIKGIAGRSGLSVSNIGDLNNDGFDDLIIGAPNASPNGINDSGQSYVVFGGTNVGSGGTLNLSDLNGINGFAINGIAPGDEIGWSVSDAGDINNDGVDDVIIGAFFASPNGNTWAGQSYVLFGGTNVGSTDILNLTGTLDADTLVGTVGNNIIDGLAGIDTLTGNGGQDKFVFRSGNGNDIITDFGGVGTGSNPSAAVIDNVDTLEFIGAGLTARNLQLTQIGNNLEVTFENVASTKVTLQNFKSENLDNLPATPSRGVLGNILFDGQAQISDSFDVINANSTQSSIFNKNTVTFLNDLNNNIAGFNNSNDVINGQGGDDIIDSKSGDDLLRGGTGNDTLVGGEGNDTLVGGTGNDTFIVRLGDGNDIITDFGGVGNIDTLQFIGAGLTARNLLLNENYDYLQNYSYLEITFENVASTKVSLQNFKLENLDNPANPSLGTLGNIQFDGETSITDSFDVINADFYQTSILKENTVTFINAYSRNITGFDNSNDVINSVGGSNTIDGKSGDDLLRGSRYYNDTLIGGTGNDTLVAGSSGNTTFVVRLGDGNDIITNFDGVGTGYDPSEVVAENFDTLQFIGTGLTARNLQLTQNRNNLEVTFENAANTKVTLQNFQLENLDNEFARVISRNIGNIQFDGETTIRNSIDVIDANSTQGSIFNKNTVTFLNELNNKIAGFDNSNDVINGQGGNDKIDGLSGDDLLRGDAGNDTLIGGAGNDTLVGGAGADSFLYNTNAAFASSAVGQDTITDLNPLQGDNIILDKTTFSAITSAAGTGFSKKSDFQVTNLGGTSTAKIVYNSVTGELFYNENGSAAGFGSGGLFATLTGAPTLTASDFLVQA